MASGVTYLPSIQGERIRSEPVEPLTESEVDEYVDGHSAGVVECRMKGRHDFPLPRPGVPPQFVEYDQVADLYIAELPCPVCTLAVQIQWWQIVPVGGSRRRGTDQVRCYKVHQRTGYRRGVGGETYGMPPGRGRLTARMVQNSVMTAAFSGQSLAALTKALKRQH